MNSQRTGGFRETLSSERVGRPRPGRAPSVRQPSAAPALERVDGQQQHERNEQHDQRDGRRPA